MTLYKWKERRWRKEERRGNQGEAKGREDRLRVAEGDDEEWGGRAKRRVGKMIRIKRERGLREKRKEWDGAGGREGEERNRREKEKQTKTNNFIILNHECAACCLMLQYNEDLYIFINHKE